jgi:hypothetical protein
VILFASAPKSGSRDDLIAAGGRFAAYWNSRRQTKDWALI